MVRPKLSFEVKADKMKAIADYVRTHVSSISFLNVSGHVKLGIEKEDGVLENSYFFTCDCELSKGDEGEPIVTGLTGIHVGERI